MSLVMWATASAALSSDDSSPHDVIRTVTVFPITDRVSGTDLSAIVLGHRKVLISPGANFTDVTAEIVFVLLSARFWSHNLLLHFSTSNDLEALFFSRWKDDGWWRRCFLYDNLLRIWSALTDDNWLR